MRAIYTPALLLLAVAFICARIIFRALFSPLRQIPGPFIARFTKLWYFYAVWRGDAEKRIIALHRQYAKPGVHYAPVVRVGPNLYSLARPDKSVYGIKSRMQKNTWYNGWGHPDPDRCTLFTDRNVKRHGETRRMVASMYAMSAVVSYEKHVDDCTEIFQTRLEEMAERRVAVDMAHWFQCFAFDMIGNITYGKRYGFLDEGKDIEHTMRALDKAMSYSTLVGVFAWAHPYIYPILERIPSTGAAGRAYLMRFASNIIANRKKERAQQLPNSKRLEEGGQDTTEDFLDKILTMKENEKTGVTDSHVLSMSLSNIFAGSDTTAVTISGILYHLIRTPKAMRCLREEVEEFTQSGHCEAGRVDFKTSQDMRYLQACIKEGLRIHSATALPMWRVVEKNGAEACGQFFPAGTEVGTSAWTAHFDEDVYGADVNAFRPERWLEAEADSARFKTMEANWMPFGLGSRTCIGRHISHLEISKLLPQIVRNFDFELEHPEGEWKVQNCWFIKPVNFRVFVKKRS
ncbi:hypothetical protein ACN47E_008719 [Coniothyrium glycines]